MQAKQKGLLGRSIWMAIGLGVLACQESAKVSAKQALPEEDVTAEHHRMPPLPRTRLTLEGSFSRQAEVFWVEVANTPQARERGLMWRKSLGPREGMLFDFGHEREVSFWMKNTLIGLDLVFISEAQTVVGTLERATPQSLSPLSIGLPSRYVLEVPSGTCAKVGVRVGSWVQWEAWQ